MIPLPLALSLSSSLTKIGAVAAVAALVGVAILSLLSFSQARELRRLRDWAGRAPEGAADLEQRVGEDAPAQAAAPPSAVQQMSPGLGAAPINPGPTSRAGPHPRVPGAIPGSSVPGTVGQTGTAQPQVQSQPPMPAIAAVAAAAASLGVPSSPGGGAPPGDAGAPPGDRTAPARPPVEAPAAAPPVPSVPATAASAVPGSESAHPGGSAPAVPATAAHVPATVAAGAGAGALSASGRPAPPDPALEPASPGGPAGEPPAPRDPTSEPPAPATVAARAAALSGRAPVSVAAGAGDGEAGSPSADGGSVATSAPPAGPPTDRPLPSAPRHGAERLPPAPPPRRRGGAAASSGRAEPVFVSGPSARSSRRSPAREKAPIVAGVLIAIAVLAVILLASGAFSGKGAAHRTPRRSAHVRHTRASAPPASPAEMHVAVLNGTNTTGLAHRLSASLQQSGYSQATALGGTPPGAHQVTVVEYATGDRADAKLVARALSVSQVQPLEASVATLAGGASVVVVAGLDKAGGAGEGGEAVP